MESVAGPQLFIDCCSPLMPLSKIEDGMGVGDGWDVGVVVKVASGVDWSAIVVGSVRAKLTAGADWVGMAVG